MVNGLQKKAAENRLNYLPSYSRSNNTFTNYYLNSIYQRIPKSELGQMHRVSFAESYAPTGTSSKISASDPRYLRQRRSNFIRHLLDTRYPELKKGSRQYNDVYTNLYRSGEINHQNFRNKYNNRYNKDHNTYPDLDINKFHPQTIRKYDEMRKWIAGNRTPKANQTIV